MRYVLWDCFHIKIAMALWFFRRYHCVEFVVLFVYNAVLARLGAWESNVTNQGLQVSQNPLLTKLWIGKASDIFQIKVLDISWTKIEKIKWMKMLCRKYGLQAIIWFLDPLSVFSLSSCKLASAAASIVIHCNSQLLVKFSWLVIMFLKLGDRRK